MSKFQIKGYNHDGILLNVSGERDAFGCEIERVTVTDSQIDIFDLFRPTAIERMALIAEEMLRQEARTQNAAARAERHQWHKEFAIA